MPNEIIPSSVGDQKPTIPDDGSPAGHIDKMLGNKPEPKEGEEGYVAPADRVAPRPDNVPEKFWDAEKGVVNTEALLKSQADAEAALRKGDPKPEPKEGEEGYVAPAEGQGKAVADASAEFAEKGELTPETFTALEAVGLSKEMVNAYIDGQKAVVSNLQEAAYSPFEGKDGYDKAATWAAENMDEEAIKALDVQLTSNNPAIVAKGAEALAAKYVAEADIEPDTIRGNANDSTAGGTYKSSREMMKDMASQKYKTDESFRKEVAAKIGRSPNL